MQPRELTDVRPPQPTDAGPQHQPAQSNQQRQNPQTQPSRADSADATGTRRPSRLLALDGLRGLAALVVLAHHAALTNPGFPGAVEDPLASPGSLTWWFSYTPLKLLTAGTEAVIVFFVLSGLVVTLPVLRRPGFDWIAYFPRRMVRLGVPVVASVLLAAAFVFAIPQRGLPGASTWLRDSSTPRLTWQLLVQAVDRLGGDAHINNPLWSLRWELLFSLALPAFVVLAAALRRWWLASIAGCLLLTWLGLAGDSAGFQFLPAFFVGALLAVRMDAVRAFAGRVNARRARHVLWAGITVGGSMLLIASWFTGLLPVHDDRVARALSGLAPAAAALLIVAAIGWDPLRLLFSSRPLQFVGRISFSLYLVHVPILIFTTYLTGGHSWLAAVALGAALSILVATGFWWLLESPSHGWARRTGEWASRCYAARVGSSAVTSGILTPARGARE